jgi:beta-lactamase class A
VLAAIALLAFAKPVDLAPLRHRLDTLCARFPGRMGYALTLLKDGRHIDFRGDERFPTASTIKTAVALEAIRQVEEGRLKWTDHREVPPLNGREASMWSYAFKDGTKLDVDGWVNLMVTVSDNTATIVMREWLTPDAVNARMASLGLPNTKVLWSRFPADSSGARLRRQFGLGVTTPNEMGRLLEMLYRRKAASEAGCEKLIRILAKQYWDDAIGATVPTDVRVASKSGAINRSRSDTAIVFSPTQPYVLTIYTDSQKDQRWSSENAGDQALVQVGTLVWNHLHPHRPYRLPAGYEKFAPTGGGLE